MGERLDYGPGPGPDENEEVKPAENSTEDSKNEGDQNPKDVIYIKTDIGYFPI